MSYQRKSKRREAPEEVVDNKPSASEKCVVTAKIPQELFDKCEDVRNSLDIKTRNELIERALRLYIAAYAYGVSKGAKGGMN